MTMASEERFGSGGSLMLVVDRCVLLGFLPPTSHPRDSRMRVQSEALHPLNGSRTHNKNHQVHIIYIKYKNHRLRIYTCLSTLFHFDEATVSY